MTKIGFTELDGYGLSGALWGKMAEPGSRCIQSGNQSFGFFDDFMKLSDTTLEDGYIKLAGSGCSVAQISSEANHPGIVRITMDGTKDDEGVIQLGNGLDIGAFRFSSDLAFEAYIRGSANAIVTLVNAMFVGLATGGSAGAAITDKLFVDDAANVTALFATIDCVGFLHQNANTTGVDGVYQVSGTAEVDGDVNTDLADIATMAADTWIKLGFRYRHYPRKLEWYVNGAQVASIGRTALDASNFPDGADDFMQPTVGIKIGAGAAATNIDIDWWAAAQLS